ncbi:MAG: hypothetical protein ACE5JX_02570 [Acidobacteriota bacterium]
MIHLRWLAKVSILLLCALAAPNIVPPVAAQPVCVQEVPIPGAPPAGTMIRRDLAIDSGGRVWFTQLELNQIGSFEPATGEFGIFDVPTPNSGPHSIDVDSQGIVWFSETEGHQLGRFDPALETFSEEPTPSPNSMPYGTAIDASDNVWFTEMNEVKVIERLASTGEMVEFPLNPVSDGVENLTIDPATGHVWVTDLVHGRLIRLDPATGVFTRFDIPFFLSSPHSVAVAPNGRVWFSDVVRNQIGQLDPASGQFQRFPIPTRGAVSHGITVDSRRLIWFVELVAGKIGLLIPQLGNRIIEFDLPTPNASPYFIAEAPDGEIWFTESSVPNLGRLPCTAR